MEPRITPSGTTDLRHSPPELHRPKASLGQWVGWLGGYSLYLLFHVVFLPFVLVRFMGRLHSGRYRGVIWTRFAGGSRPPEPASDWTLIIASGLGETRTGLQAAEEIYRVGDGRVALLTQLSRMPSALKRENPPFEIGFAPFNSPHAALIALLRWKPRSIPFVEFSGNYHLAFLARMMGVRTALINVNTATAAELDGLPQIGPARSKAIMDNRVAAKGGAYKDIADLEKRADLPSNAIAAIKDKIRFR